MVPTKIRDCGFASAAVRAQEMPLLTNLSESSSSEDVVKMKLRTVASEFDNASRRSHRCQVPRGPKSSLL